MAAAAVIGAAVAFPGDGPVLDVAALAAFGARAAKIAAALGIPLAITGDQGPQIPVFPVSRSVTPNIADNIQAATGGAPTVLNRETDPRQIARNRRAALRGQPRPPPGFSLDEFPFASTLQGGAGARVAPVPVGEQAIQGGSLSSFFQANKIGQGGPFIVIVVP